MSSTHLPILQGPGAQSPDADKLPGIRHVIAIASGKGGVGKSTVTVNLALALRKAGFKVGVVDADVLGPSIPAMLGAAYGEQPQVQDERFIPEERHGIKLISMGLLTSHDQPAILRGPMVTKYIRMFIGGVTWGKLDYLLIDLPPGTGDIQLTLAQSIPLTGAVIVTTPQDVSLNITRRGLRMFEKVRVPILGVVENMSSFVCPHCGEASDIFKKGGGARMGKELGVELLGAVPLDANIVIGGDSGTPLLVAHPESLSTKAYHDIADALMRAVDKGAAAGLPPFEWTWTTDGGAPPWGKVPTPPGPANAPVGMKKRDARTLSILWADGAEASYDVRDLRIGCPCAMCVDENSGKRTLIPENVPLDVQPVSITAVGHYAIALNYSDGHSTGIYSYERLRQLADKPSGGFEV